MAQARKSTGRTGRTASQRQRSGQQALDRLNAALEEAQKALTEVRRSVGSSGSDLVKDVEKVLRNGRKEARKVTRALRKELNQLGETLTPGRGRKTAARRTVKRATTTKRRATAKRGAAAKRRTTAAKKRAPAKRRTTAAKKRAPAKRRKSTTRAKAAKRS